MTAPVSYEKSRRSLEALAVHQARMKDPNGSVADVLLTVAGIIHEHLQQEKIQAVVVGGTSVELYSSGGYTTRDLDLFTDENRRVRVILETLGFQKNGRIFEHPSIGVLVDLPSGEFKGDYDNILLLDHEGYTVPVIGIEDIVIDRLTNAVNTANTYDLVWARKLLAAQADEVDWDYFSVTQLQKEMYGLTRDHIDKLRYFVYGTRVLIVEAFKENTALDLEDTITDIELLRDRITIQEAIERSGEEKAD